MDFMQRLVLVVAFFQNMSHCQYTLHFTIYVMILLLLLTWFVVYSNDSQFDYFKFNIFVSYYFKGVINLAAVGRRGYKVPNKGTIQVVCKWLW